MRPIAVLHHLKRPSAALAAGTLGHTLEVDRRRGDPLPSLEDVAAIVTFGGEQSVRDIASLPELGEEAELLRKAVRREVPVLGVCLGSQLLAHALGGEVRRMPRRQIGWHRLEPLPAAGDDPLFGALPAPVPVLHWNEDAFDVPEGAVELLPRTGPGGEAFRAGPAAWGVQFHPEADPGLLETWYEGAGEQLADAGVSEDDARSADREHMPAQRRLAEALFGEFARLARS